MKNKRNIQIVLCCCLALVIFVGAAFALLQSSDSRTQHLTQSSLTISAINQHWDEVKASNMAPTQTINKQPKFKNDDNNVAAWVFASVKIPSTNIQYNIGSVTPVDKTADGTTLKNNIGDYYDLFTYKVNKGWSLVAVDATHRNQNSGYTIYYYAYSNILAANAITDTALFNAISLANLEERPAEDTGTIDIQGLGIQQPGISNAYQGWAVFANQNSYNTLTYYNSHYIVSNNIVNYKAN